MWERGGKGLFRFNHSLFNDAGFVADVRNEIKQAKEETGIYSGVSDIGLKIEIFSSEVRVRSMRANKLKAE